jgi:hypothetical protein
MAKTIRLARQWPFAAAICVALVALAPSLAVGYVNDDVLTSTLPGYWKVTRIHPVRETLLQVKAWVTTCGRFNPLMHVWKNAWFYVVRDLLANKVVILAMVAANLWLLYRLCRALAQPRATAAFACLLAAVLIQFRVPNDPVLAFNGTMQLVAGLALGSLLALCKYRLSGRRRWLAVSLLLHLAGCLTYECCVLLCVAHAALLAGDGRGRLLLRAAPFVAAGAAVVLINLGIRATVTLPPGNLYEMALEPQTVLATFRRQCLAAVPLSYGACDPDEVFTHAGFLLESLDQAWIALLILPFACAMAHRLPASPPSLFLLLFGASLAVLPAAPIAVCFRYQNELRDGLGHLPVYLQTFGVALLVTAAVPWAARRLAGVPWGRHALAAALGLACAAVATGHRASNAAVVRHYLPETLWRSEVEDLYRAGLLDPVPKGAVLVSDLSKWDHHTHAKAFVLQHARKRLDVRPPIGAEVRRLEGAWRLIRSNGPSDGGVIVLGKLGEFPYPETNMRLHRVAVRTHTLDGRPLPPRRFTVHSFGAAPVALPSSGLRVALRTDHWVVYELPSPAVINEAAAWLEFPRTDGGQPGTATGQGG